MQNNNNNNYQQPQYQQPQYQQPYPQYQAYPTYRPTDDTNYVSIGSWILTFIISSIPLVGFIYIIVLLFGGSKQKAKVNFVRASVILGLIGFVIVVVVFLALGYSFSTLTDSFTDYSQSQAQF